MAKKFMKEAFDKSKNDFNFDPWQSECSKEEFDYINKSKFDSIIDKNLGHDGGYANNKNDRGGETNWGITKPFMEEFKYALPGGKSVPIKDLSVDDAKKMYKAMWDRYNLGYIRDKNVAYTIFDYMINTYHHTAAKRVQHILNTQGASLKVDGRIGEKSLEAIHNSDAKWLIDEILKNRQHNYRKQVKDASNQHIFYAGWMNRLNKIAESVGSELYFSPHF